MWPTEVDNDAASRVILQALITVRLWRYQVLRTFSKAQPLLIRVQTSVHFHLVSAYAQPVSTYAHPTFCKPLSPGLLHSHHIKVHQYPRQENKIHYVPSVMSAQSS